MSIWTENVVTSAIGIVLIAGAFLGRTLSYGVAPIRDKPQYPITRAQRLILFVFGALFLYLGVAGLLLGKRLLN